MVHASCGAMIWECATVVDDCKPGKPKNLEKKSVTNFA
jgi:hypothetical protein